MKQFVITKFSEFNLTEASYSTHYNCRKKYRLGIPDSLLYTTPEFDYNRYSTQIDLIENITYPETRICVI